MSIPYEKEYHIRHNVSKIDIFQEVHTIITLYHHLKVDVFQSKKYPLKVI